ncbi:UNVERIFIED_CONTAM: hypothetical protein HDU68_011308 [Siphonaria sp. JEL0065]|nr:hypothetical protein HDU68_011308 [Siphonaria sp. JEL0065]
MLRFPQLYKTSGSNSTAGGKPTGGYPPYPPSIRPRPAASAVMHTSLGNGKYHVPATENNVFLREYARYLKTGHSQLMLTERVLPDIPFRFFMDIDFPLNNKASGYIHFPLILEAVEEVLRECLDDKVGLPGPSEGGYPGLPPSVLSTRLSKVHVHCPGVIVNEATAKHFFTLIRDKLALCLQISDAQEIANVFDESVYKSGLRMLGSWKPSGKRDKDPDWVHRHKTYMYLDADYEPIDLYVEDDEDFAVEILGKCSIINLDGRPETVFKPNSAPGSQVPSNRKRNSSGTTYFVKGLNTHKLR